MRNKFTWKPGMRRLALRGFRKYCFLGALHPAAWGEVPEGFFKRPVHGIVLELVRVGPGTSPPPHIFFLSSQLILVCRLVGATLALLELPQLVP